MKAKDSSVDNLVGIFHRFGFAYGLEINWDKEVAYLCSHKTQPCLVEKYQWKWIHVGDLSKLLDTMFGLHLELENVHQFLVNMVKAKLKYWNTTYLSFVGRTFIVNQVLMFIVWYFVVVWA